VRTIDCGGGTRREVSVSAAAGRPEVRVDGTPFHPDVQPLGPGRFLWRDGDRLEVFHCVRDGDVIHLFWRGEVYRLVDEGEGRRPSARQVAGGLEAPMPGRVIKVAVEVGQEVAKGQEVLVVESMKMENALRAPHAGRVTALSAEVGEMVAPGRVLVEIEPA